jgi:hypothetical protein
LKGHFHVSQELYNVVVEAEKVTKKQARKKAKTKGKADSYETESEGDIEEEGQDKSKSEIGDYIIVDIE